MADRDTGGFDYDPFSPEAMANPLPFYEVLRRDHPVYYSAKYDAFFFSRFDDVVEMLDHVDNSFPRQRELAADGILSRRPA